MKRATKVLAFTLLAGIDAHAQLHIITGKPTPIENWSYAVDLLKIGSDGSVAEVEQLATAKEGMEWIDTADDAGILTLVTVAPEFKVVVVDTHQGKMVKRCEHWPDVPGYISSQQWPLEEWLVGDGKGNLFVGRYGFRGDYDDILQGISVAPAVSCDASFQILGPTDVAKVNVQGHGGIVALTGVGQADFLVDSEGGVRLRLGSDYIYFGYSVPREYWGDMKVPLGSVYANNSKVILMYYWDREDTSHSHTIAYDKVSQKWSEVPLPGIPLVRAFGSSVAMSERVQPAAPTAASSDKPNRRVTATANGPAKKYTFEEEARQGRAYPGRLHVYNVATGISTVIVTNQEDSEVLLVDGDTIHYRVDNNIYSSQAGSSGVLPGNLMATDDRIRDAHWAFLKR